MYGGGVGMGMAGLWWTLIALGVVLLILLVVWLVVSSGRRGGAVDQPPTGHRTAREILDERYAKGDLTTDEYKERLRALTEER